MTIANTSKQQITIELLQKKYLEQTISLLVDVFTSSEPLTTAIGITADEFYSFAEIICKRAIINNLSHIAINTETSEVLGAVISEDWATQLSEDAGNFHQKFDIMFALVKDLHEQYETTRKVVRGKLLHIFLLAVKEQYRNKGIARNLLAENIERARQENFSGAVIEVTGQISQYLARYHGFEERGSIDYQTYQYKGRKVFEGIKDHQRCILMEKVLT